MICTNPVHLDSIMVNQYVEYLDQKTLSSSKKNVRTNRQIHILY